jgi:hypothetical protein
MPKPRTPARIALFAANLSVESLADYLDLSLSHVEKCLNGERKATPEFRQGVVDFLGRKIPAHLLWPEDGNA